ncbi:polyamine aminopropyltransferase [Oligoflexus tunisiensis]|uniref:polyamine aminopropyltransferase n=1 Tax=Oligoflexus tunisiensis TaxID=708132 RepID=UPI000AB3381C|nr:polyamine aminopropyltransferase [Oligoflexus tunisiensis]
MALLLLISVFVIATAGLVYELIAGTLASYLLGDSVTQFSTVIGAYLSSMGVGSWLSRYVKRDLLRFFIHVELLLAVIGGSSAALLFCLFDQVSNFRLLLYSLVSITGVLVGVEIPILMRILKDEYAFQDLVAKVFTFDYLGALLASLLFPMLLVPHLGLVRSAFFFGTCNALVAWAALEILGRQQAWRRVQRVMVLLTLGFCGTGLAMGERLTNWSESLTFADPVIAAVSSPYQRLVLTRNQRDTRLFLNGNLQFSSADEYRYHEALVHPGLASFKAARQVLILGGGDGLALREVLRYPTVERVVLVDLDRAVTDLAAQHPILRALNQEALASPKLQLVHQDAFTWLRTATEQFDFIVIDFPDPSSFAIGKLYSTRFYELVKAALRENGQMVVQSTSPYYARRTFWTIVNTLNAVGFHTAPYHVHVPSFGEWGFVLAGHQPYRWPTELPEGLRFLSLDLLPGIFHFPPDMQATVSAINRLDNQVLVRTFEEEWSRHVH